jgi:hypothetical protein
MFNSIHLLHVAVSGQLPDIGSMQGKDRYADAKGQAQAGRRSPSARSIGLKSRRPFDSFKSDAAGGVRHAHSNPIQAPEE